MADKKIKIHIASSADLRAMKDVSTEAVLMTRQVKSANAELRQAILKTAADYDSIAAKADRAARGMGTGYKTLGDFLRDIKRDSAAADKNLEVIRAKIQAVEKAAAAARAERAMKRLGTSSADASKKVVSLGQSIKMLTTGTGFLGKALTAALGGGIFTAAAAGVRALFSLAKKNIDEQIEDAKRLKEAAEKNIEAMTARLEKYSSGIADVAKAERDAIEASLAARNNELDITERLTKATIELARQKRIAAGEDIATVNAESDASLNVASDDAKRQKSDARMDAIRRRLESAENQRDDAWAEVERLRDARALNDEQMDYAETPEEKKRSSAFRKSIADAIEREKATAFDAEKRIAKEQKALEGERQSREALEMEIAARDVKLANERVELDPEKESRLLANNVQSQDVTLGVRPEHTDLNEKGGITGKVDVAEMMGSSVHLHITAEGRDVIIIVPTVDMKGNFSMGDEVRFTFRGNVAHVFSKETDKNLEF